MVGNGEISGRGVISTSGSYCIVAYKPDVVADIYKAIHVSAFVGQDICICCHPKSDRNELHTTRVGQCHKYKRKQEMMEAKQLKDQALGGRYSSRSTALILLLFYTTLVTCEVCKVPPP